MAIQTQRLVAFEDESIVLSFDWDDGDGDVVLARCVNTSPTDDVTTTGWTSTPLWSKVDDDPDSPDATVISATAS